MEKVGAQAGSINHKYGSRAYKDYSLFWACPDFNGSGPVISISRLILDKVPQSHTLAWKKGAVYLWRTSITRQGIKVLESF